MAQLFFNDLEARAAARLIQLGIETRFERGAFLFRPRDESGQFYFVISGDIALEQPGQERTTRIQTLHTGDFLGWSALLGCGTRRFQARAITPALVLSFDGELLRKACEDDPRFGYALMKRLLSIATERLDNARTQIGALQQGYVRDWASAAGA